jgi:hypothetical protein
MFKTNAVITLLLAIVAVCLFGGVLRSEIGIFREFQAALLSVNWMLLACLAVWCNCFTFLTFGRADWSLIGLLLIAMIAYFIGYMASSRAADALILFAGVTMGKGAKLLLKAEGGKRESGNFSNEEGRMKNEECGDILEKRNPSSLGFDAAGAESGNTVEKRKSESEKAGNWVNEEGRMENEECNSEVGGRKPDVSGQKAEVGSFSEIGNRKSEIGNFLMGLVALLAFSAWWHLEVMNRFYPPGVRWTGLYDNPNIYGMLMGAGVVLAIGLLTQNLKSEKLKTEIGKRIILRSFAAVKSEIGNRKSKIFLCIAAGMMAVGLFFSYSRGAWVATAVGLLYLAMAFGKAESGKRKAKIIWYLLPMVAVVAAVVIFFWHNTADTDPWYLKRLDLSRASAQHRVSAWRGALQIMRDHPFGVGWNKAVGVYDKDYSPPEKGAAALTMNSYLMLGTELGLPGLICFVGYVALCFRTKRHLTPALSPFDPSAPVKRGEGELLAVTQQSTSPVTFHSSLQTACRAGAVVLLVAFWFDGGLFTLATASVFWVLLELGTETQNRESGKRESGNGRES